MSTKIFYDPMTVHLLKNTNCILIFILIFLLSGIHFPLNAQRLSRDKNVDLLINQAGYLPYSAKKAVTKGEKEIDFDVINIETMKVAYSGTLTPKKGDFGTYLTGDFSTLSQPGVYYVKSDTLRSYPFEISSTVYDSPMSLIVHYFSKQRCGASKTGYLSPCHVDDGIRMDNGKHQDVTGGWHDASDLRQWVGATIYGVVGLAKAYELNDSPAFRKKVMEELRWGNQYFLKMQEPQGYVMNYVGGDVRKHSDSNRWTDNEVGEEGGELHFVKPNAGESTADMLIFDANDDRVIRTDPAGLMGQYNFVIGEAMLARIFKKEDPSYAVQCEKAAIKCFDWSMDQDEDMDAGVMGAAIQASIELYKTTHQTQYQDHAAKLASELKQLQETDSRGDINGFFYRQSSGREPYKNISRGCWEFIAVSDLIQTFPAHNDVESWKEMISIYANQYLVFMSAKNNFGIVPFGLFTEAPGGNRKTGQYWYRYFMQPELDWWVGINANIASAGVGLVKAAAILDEPELLARAQRQLDWIIGVNPFNSSTLIGVGYNHPEHFPGSTFIPTTPVIQGAVMNGLGGDRNDMPVIGTGIWQISEYWTPMVAYTLWLLAELADN